MDEYSIVGGDGNEYGPVSADEIRSWIKQGRANAQTMASKGDGGKMSLGSYPEFSDLLSGAARPAPVTPSQSVNPPGFPQTGSAPSMYGNTGSSTEVREVVMNIMEPISSAAGWMKFISVMFFVWAGLGILGSWGIGIIVAWLPIWMGVLIWKAATRAQAVMIDGSEYTAEAALASIKTYFTLMGVLMLLYVVLIIGVIIFAVIMGLTGAMVSDPSYY